MTNPSASVSAVASNDAYDISIAPTYTSESPFAEWWLLPSSSQILFAGISGGSSGLAYNISIKPVYSSSLCGSGKLTGAACGGSGQLSDGVLCPPASVESCHSYMSQITAATGQKSQSVNLKYDQQGDQTNFVTFKVTEALFSLDLVLRISSTEAANLDKGEQWSLVAHFDGFPNMLNSTYIHQYPYSTSTTISLPVDTKSALLSLNVPYPQPGTWVMAVSRVFPTPGFGQQAPDKLAATVLLSAAQSFCPNSCFSRGVCNQDTHVCTCNHGYYLVDCSATNQTKAPVHDGGDGLGVGLGVSLPVIGVLTLLAVAYIIWRETRSSKFETV